MKLCLQLCLFCPWCMISLSLCQSMSLILFSPPVLCRSGKKWANIQYIFYYCSSTAVRNHGNSFYVPSYLKIIKSVFQNSHCVTYHGLACHLMCEDCYNEELSFQLSVKAIVVFPAFQYLHIFHPNTILCKTYKKQIIKSTTSLYLIVFNV